MRNQNRSRSEVAAEKFADAVSVAVAELGQDLGEIALVVASEYHEPPRYKDVFNAKEFLDGVIAGDIVPTPKCKMFFPVCSALGISPLDFDFCGVYLTDIKKYLERKQKHLES